MRKCVCVMLSLVAGTGYVSGIGDGPSLPEGKKGRKCRGVRAQQRGVDTREAHGGRRKKGGKVKMKRQEEEDEPN